MLPFEQGFQSFVEKTVLVGLTGQFSVNLQQLLLQLLLEIGHFLKFRFPFQFFLFKFTQRFLSRFNPCFQLIGQGTSLIPVPFQKLQFVLKLRKFFSLSLLLFIDIFQILAFKVPLIFCFLNFSLFFINLFTPLLNFRTTLRLLKTQLLQSSFLCSQVILYILMFLTVFLDALTRLLFIRPRLMPIEA